MVELVGKKLLTARLIGTFSFFLSFFQSSDFQCIWPCHPGVSIPGICTHFFFSPPIFRVSGLDIPVSWSPGICIWFFLFIYFSVLRFSVYLALPSRCLGPPGFVYVLFQSSKFPCIWPSHPGFCLCVSAPGICRFFFLVLRFPVQLALSSRDLCLTWPYQATRGQFGDIQLLVWSGPIQSGRVQTQSGPVPPLCSVWPCPSFVDILALSQLHFQYSPTPLTISLCPSFTYNLALSHLCIQFHLRKTKISHDRLQNISTPEPLY